MAAGSAWANPMMPQNPGKDTILAPKGYENGLLANQLPLPATPMNILTLEPENQFDKWADIPWLATDTIGASMARKGFLQAGQFGNNSILSGFWRQKEAKWYLIGGFHWQKARKYDDGDGHEVNFGYDRNGQFIVLGAVPRPWIDAKVALIRDSLENDKQPHFVMDPKETRRIVARAEARIGKPDNTQTVNVSVKNINLKRRAGNFYLRPTEPGQPKIRMAVDRNITDFDVNFNKAFEGGHFARAGITYAFDDMVAKRFAVTPAKDIHNAFKMPDVEQHSVKLYGGYTYTFNPMHKIAVGLAWDWNSADPKEKNHVFQGGFPSPNMLYKKYYGKMVDKAVEKNGISGKIRYTLSLDKGTKNIFVEGKSLMRIGDNNERFSSVPGPNGMSTVGNPFIKPERHNKIELGANLKGQGWGGYMKPKADDFLHSWNLTASLWYDSVSDMIIYDRARSQSGIVQGLYTGDVINRNVDAVVAGASLNYKHNLSNKLAIRIGTEYMYGENTTDKRPLYQIRPWTSHVGFDYQDYFKYGSWSAGMVARYIAKQDRLDDNPLTGLGTDLKEAAKAHTVLDAHFAIQFRNRFGVSFGVDNILNEKYADFLNGKHIDSIATSLVYAPGRTFWGRIHFNF